MFDINFAQIISYSLSTFALHFQINKIVLSMLGRRSIRIKAMQALYSMQTNEALQLEDAEKLLNTSIENFISMYQFTLFTFYKTIEFTEKDAEIKASKLIQTDEIVEAKLLTNALYIHLKESSNFTTIVEKKKFRNKLENNTIHNLYKEIRENEMYQNYVSDKLTTEEDDYKIALHIINKIMLKNEVFQQNLDDVFTNYEDDFSGVKNLLHKQLKEIVKTLNKEIIFFNRNSFYTELGFFAKNLLYKTVDHSGALDDEIKDYLHNWDVERLALIDVLLLKMAVCEFLFFQDIPTKVTINEYIEISKRYSTPKSKEFINGVLDRMMKKMSETGRIKKSGRGLK